MFKGVCANLNPKNSRYRLFIVASGKPLKGGAIWNPNNVHPPPPLTLKPGSATDYAFIWQRDTCIHSPWSDLISHTQ